MKVSLIWILSCFIFSCNSRSGTLTTVRLNETEAKFGKINIKDTIKYNFLIRNTGKNDLIIDTVTASCGCIHDTWSKHPIAPSGFGYIAVAFKPDRLDSGEVSKTVMVVTNTKQVYVPLNITYSVN
jgi:hypothetical protein